MAGGPGLALLAAALLAAGSAALSLSAAAASGPQSPRPKSPRKQGTCVGSASYDTYLHVLGWLRPESLRLLLGQLEGVRYYARAPLHIHVDGGASPAVLQAVRTFHWSHGQKILHIQRANRGLRETWLQSVTAAARQAPPDSLQVVFEDDIRVSPHFTLWLRLVLHRYAGRSSCRDKSLMGISLSPIREDELSPDKSLVDRVFNESFGSSVCLSTLPSSWGAAYFTDRWLEFAAFARVRAGPPFYNKAGENKANCGDSPPALNVPGSKSNCWTQSWKRFMVDYMYGRAGWMLYPSLPGSLALATTLAPANSVHSGAKDTPDDTAALRPSEAALRRPTVSAALVEDAAPLKHMALPPYSWLPRLDLFLRRTSIREAEATAKGFLAGLSKDASLAEVRRAWASRPASGGHRRRRGHGRHGRR